MARRYALNKDANHAQIVRDLEAIGWDVLDLAAYGCSEADIVVGAAGHNTLIEIKSKGGKESPVQTEFARMWRGQVATAFTLDDAVAAVHGVIGRRG